MFLICVVLLFLTGRTMPDMLKHSVLYTWPPSGQSLYSLWSPGRTQMTTSCRHYLLRFWMSRMIRASLYHQALLLMALALPSRLKILIAAWLMLVTFLYLHLKVTQVFLHCNCRVRVFRYCRLCSLASCQCSYLSNLNSAHKISNHGPTRGIAPPEFNCLQAF